MAKSYDAIIIGAGQAGPTLAWRLSSSGMNVAIAERKLFGGTCVNTGCFPTKTLVASARAAYVAGRGAEFGVVINGEVSVDMKIVKARKDAVVKRSNEGLEQWLKGMDNCDVYEGHARFEGSKTFRIGDELLEAPKVFINVGARAFIPPIPGIEDVEYLTNSGMMEVDFVPEHLIIVGGSYIGLEFGQMYRRFGSRVTVVEQGPRLIHNDDDDISEAVRGIMENEGVELRLDSECVKVGRGGDGVVVELNCDDPEKEVTGTHLLLAVGRTPNTEDLGLENTGIEVDKHGYIVVDDQLRTKVDGVWALGDCNGKGTFTHTSYNDYEIVAANILDGNPRRVTDRILCYALYIDPPLGRAGMTKTQARESGRNVLVARRDMVNVARAWEKGETQGFMEVLVDADSKEILGAAVLGIGGDEIIHSVLDIMYAGAPYTVIQRAVHIHPTVSELIPTMLGSLLPLE